MQRLSSLLLILLATFAALFSISCVKAQQDGDGRTVDSLRSVIVECNLIRDVCSSMSSWNVYYKGQLVDDGLGSTATVAREIGLGLQESGPGSFSTPNVILQTAGELAGTMKALLTELTEKRAVLKNAGFGGSIANSLHNLVSEVDLMTQGLHSHLSTGDQRALDRTMSSLDKAFQRSINAFS